MAEEAEKPQGGGRSGAGVEQHPAGDGTVQAHRAHVQEEEGGHAQDVTAGQDAGLLGHHGCHEGCPGPEEQAQGCC